jgi:hypothetical protein
VCTCARLREGYGAATVAAGVHGPGYARLTFALLCAILQTALRATVTLCFAVLDFSTDWGLLLVLIDFPALVMFFECAYIAVHARYTAEAARGHRARTLLLGEGALLIIILVSLLGYASDGSHGTTPLYAINAVRSVAFSVAFLSTAGVFGLFLRDAPDIEPVACVRQFCMEKAALVRFARVYIACTCAKVITMIFFYATSGAIDIGAYARSHAAQASAAASAHSIPSPLTCTLTFQMEPRWGSSSTCSTTSLGSCSRRRCSRPRRRGAAFSEMCSRSWPRALHT